MFKLLTPWILGVICIAFPPLFLFFVPAMIVWAAKIGARKRHERYLVGVYYAHQARLDRDKTMRAFR